MAFVLKTYFEYNIFADCAKVVCRPFKAAATRRLVYNINNRIASSTYYSHVI
jgi:hypothetical protein